MTDRPRSLLVPLVISVIGLVPLGLIASLPSPEPSLPPPAIAVAPPGSQTPRAETVVVTTPPPTIDGVSESVARVLAAGGFATEQSVPELPHSVVSVLRDQNAVLAVAVPES